MSTVTNLALGGLEFTRDNWIIKLTGFEKIESVMYVHCCLRSKTK